MIIGPFYAYQIIVYISPVKTVPSVLWYCWLGLLTCKNRRPYNLYCVGGDVKPCSINHQWKRFLLCGFCNCTVGPHVDAAAARPCRAYMLLVPERSFSIVNLFENCCKCARSWPFPHSTSCCFVTRWIMSPSRQSHLARKTERHFRQYIDSVFSFHCTIPTKCAIALGRLNTSITLIYESVYLTLMVPWRYIRDGFY